MSISKCLFCAAALAIPALGGVVPTLEIEQGVWMPMQGLGTWQYNDTTAELAVTEALALGYTLVDTAYIYGNQVGVGKGIAKSGRARESLFVLTKIPGGQSYENATQLLNENLEQLGLDYVDLVLVHFPSYWDGTGGKEMRVQGWKALEDFKKAGKTRSIGISHFCQRHVEDILEINTTAIAVNQVEYHIGMGNNPNATDDKTFFDNAGITYMGFSTLCGPCGTSELVNGPLVVDIGKKYGKTGAQVSLRWAIQHGVPVIPKSYHIQYLTENIDIFDWELSADDMASLDAATSPIAAGGGADHPGISGDCLIP